MSSHAKASSAGLIDGSGKSRRLGGLLAISALALCALGSGASPASAEIPSSTMGSVSAVGITSAHVTGVVTPDTEFETFYAFEFSTNQVDWARGPNAYGDGVPIPAGAGPTPVEENLVNLAAGTEYFVRLGTYEGAAVYNSPEPNPSFTTLPATAPTLTLDPATPKFTTAHLSGTVDPEGGNVDSLQGQLPIHWEFQYSRDPINEGWAPGGSGDITGAEAASSSAIGVSADPSGLQSDTEYKFRLVASYAGLTAITAEDSFETKGPITPPIVSVDDVTILTGTTAHFSGHVTPSETDPGFDSTCAFDYITEAAFENGRKEVQRLTINAASGTYKLGFAGEETAPIPYAASAAEAQSALEGIAAIGTGGVSVSGGPLKKAPFTITFQAPSNVSELGIEAAGLLGISGGGLEVTVEGYAPGFEGAQSVPCDSAASGTSPVSVKADATGLNPGIVYHLRLRASNQGGTNLQVATPFQTEAAAPVISEAFVSDVTTTSATLNARIDANGAPTTYHFEYLTLAEYEANDESFDTAQPTPESEPIAEDSEPHLLSASITDLQTDTAYRFRVVAKNAESPLGGTQGPVHPFHTHALPPGADTCPNAAIRAQQGSAFLPECRAYELVSKPSLDLGDVERVPWASNDGSKVAYLASVAENGAQSATLFNATLASRTDDGWAQVSADPRPTSDQQVVGLSTLYGLSEDGKSALLNIQTAGKLRVSVGTGKWANLTPTYPLDANSFGPLIAASSDLSRIVYDATFGGIRGLYVDDGSGAELVSVDEEGNPVGGGVSYDGIMYQSERGYRLSDGSDKSPFAEHRGVHIGSDALDMIYFGDGSVIDPADIAVYLRDLRAEPHRTIRVTASELPGHEDENFQGQFVSASHDGTEAFIWTPQRVTSVGTEGGGIYRFLADAPKGERLEQITPAVQSGSFDMEQANVSDDQSHIYFWSTAALEGTGGVSGQPNIYVWSKATGTRLIVTGPANIRRVSTDGEYAVLESGSTLADAPNNGQTAVYLYDYAANQLYCASCRPDGSPSQRGSTVAEQQIGVITSLATRSRNITTSGGVFFNSYDQLVATDHNDQNDVYLYRQGATTLISSGRPGESAYLTENSDDGKHGFFITRAALVGADRDARELDLYDAYVGGGFLEPPPPPAPCEGEACRGVPSSPGVGPVSVTQNLVGSGNPLPCRKQKVRRNGRCVKRKHRNTKHRNTNRHKGKSARGQVWVSASDRKAK